MPRYNRRRRTAADRCETTTLTGNCTHMTPGDYDYTYDPIGNRTQAVKDSAGTWYCTNNVNQYTSTDDTSGTCPTPSTPTESFVYDQDGNLIQDGTYEYIWDGENRLSIVIPLNPVNGSQAGVYTYDYMGRRIEKQVYTYDNGWIEPSEILRFVYDQWNVVLVLDGLDDNAVRTRYTWGLDLSGQRGNPTAAGIHGAGGIGGLLAAEETGTSGTPKYWFLYDANGNVGQLIENASGYAVAARYEYDAYGAVIGPDTDNDGDWQDDATALALVNPFRFSTKWFDEESGLAYWGLRYGRERWLNRDPSEEQGGTNLYALAYNSPVNKPDPLGLDTLGLPPPCPAGCTDLGWYRGCDCSKPPPPPTPFGGTGPLGDFIDCMADCIQKKQKWALIGGGIGGPIQLPVKRPPGTGFGDMRWINRVCCERGLASASDLQKLRGAGWLALGYGLGTAVIELECLAECCSGGPAAGPPSAPHACSVSTIAVTLSTWKDRVLLAWRCMCRAVDVQERPLLTEL